jgi:hypothetical protein
MSWQADTETTSSATLTQAIDQLLAMLGPERSEQFFTHGAGDLRRIIRAIGRKRAAEVSKRAVDTSRSGGTEAARDDAPRVTGRLRVHALAHAAEPACRRAWAQERR